MKSTVNELSALERQINVEVPVEKINEAFTRVFQEIQKTAELKGFRKGKAPLNVIKKMYRGRVEEDVVKDLVYGGFYEAISEHGLQPINSPDFEFDALKEDTSFSFSAKFEVRPEIALKKYEGLPVEKEKLEFDDKKVDEVLENIRNSKAENVDVFEDRPLAEGDIALLDFEGFVDGAPLENGKAEGHELEIGTNSFIEGFEQGMIGMKAGDDRTLDLKFPDEYHAKDIAGKPVQFKVRLVTIKKKSLPELNDEFVKSLDGPQDSLEALKTSIREDLEKNEVRRIEEDMKNRLLKELVRQNPVEVPPSMLTQQKKALIDDFKYRMQSQGMTEADFTEYTQKWNDDFENTAKEMIQSSFLINEISDKHELSANKDDLEKKMEDFAQQSGMDLTRVKEFYKEEEQINRLAYQVTEQKVVEFLLGKANIHEVSAEKLQEAES